MKQAKFGIFDIILIVLIVAGIGLNIFGYGFRDGGNEPRQNPALSASQSDKSGNANQSGKNNALGKPSSGDFSWFINGGYAAGTDLPSGATQLTEFSDVSGNWKGIMLFDPDHIFYDSYAYMLANIEISGKANSLKMTWNYCDYIEEGGSVVDWSGEGDMYEGRWLDEGGLLAGPEDDRFYFHIFYQLDGKQYAIGFNTPESGEPVYVAFVR